MNGIDVYRGKIRFLETNDCGGDLYNDKGKTVKHDLKIDKIEELAEVVAILKEA